jgi:hypothetical protein
MPRRTTWAAELGFDLLFRCGDQSLTNGLLAAGFAGATYRFAFLACRLGGRLFVKTTPLHFTKDPLTLHLLLQDAESLVDIVVADKDLQKTNSFCVCDGAGSVEIDRAHASIETGASDGGLRLRQTIANGICTSHVRHSGRHVTPFAIV